MIRSGKTAILVDRFPHHNNCKLFLGRDTILLQTDRPAGAWIANVVEWAKPSQLCSELIFYCEPKYLFD